MEPQERRFYSVVRVDPGGQAGAEQHVRHHHPGSTGRLDYRRLEGGLRLPTGRERLGKPDRPLQSRVSSGMMSTPRMVFRLRIAWILESVGC